MLNNDNDYYLLWELKYIEWLTKKKQQLKSETRKDIKGWQ